MESLTSSYCSGYNPVPSEYAELLLQGSSGLKQLSFPSLREERNSGGFQVPEGFLIVDKPLGITSHDVVAKVRRLAGTAKVGHAGTLDPLASGVLVLGLGRATKFMQYAQGKVKTYRARIAFGAVTETEDAASTAVLYSELSASAVRLDTQQLSTQLNGLLSSFTGDLKQLPSRVSAKKIAGKRAYDLVRAGEEVELKPVPVRISRFVLLGELEPLYLPECPGVQLLQGEFEVECSAGTYVRALARDLGEALGCGAHLRALRRIKVGNYEVAANFTSGDSGAFSAYGLFELRDIVASGNNLPLIPVAEVAKSLFASVQVDLAAAKKLVLGQRPAISSPEIFMAAGSSSSDVEEFPNPSSQIRALFLAPQFSASGQEEFLGLAVPRQGTWQVKLGWLRPEELAVKTCCE